MRRKIVSHPKLGLTIAPDNGETGVVAAAGSVLGLAAFYVVRASLAGLVPTQKGVFAGDIAPPLGFKILVLLRVPVLAVATAVPALRRVVTVPRGRPPCARRARSAVGGCCL